MSRRTPTKKQLADRQRRQARAREWDALDTKQQDLLIRRLTTMHQLRKANANAKALAA